MVAVSATRDLTSSRPYKKNWREVTEYLHNRSDKAGILLREGSVIVCDLAPLRQVKDKVDVGQW